MALALVYSEVSRSDPLSYGRPFRARTEHLTRICASAHRSFSDERTDEDHKKPAHPICHTRRSGNDFRHIPAGHPLYTEIFAKPATSGTWQNLAVVSGGRRSLLTSPASRRVGSCNTRSTATTASRRELSRELLGPDRASTWPHRQALPPPVRVDSRPAPALAHNIRRDPLESVTCPPAPAQSS